MLSLGSRLQSANVSWSPSRKRRREARRWGSWASSYSSGALRYSSSFSRARSRLRCSAAGAGQRPWVRARPHGGHGALQLHRGLLPACPRAQAAPAHAPPALPRLAPAPGPSQGSPGAATLDCARSLSACRAPAVAWSRGGPEGLRVTWAWLQGGDTRGVAWGASPSLPSPQLLTLILGRHRVLDESGELVEDVVPGQARLPVPWDQAGEPEGTRARLRKGASAGGLMCCLPTPTPRPVLPLFGPLPPLGAVPATDMGGPSLSSRKSSMVTVSVLGSSL